MDLRVVTALQMWHDHCDKFRVRWVLIYINFLFFILYLYDISDGLMKPGGFQKGGFKQNRKGGRRRILLFPTGIILKYWLAL
jgi:hypothetical protein